MLLLATVSGLSLGAPPLASQTLPITGRIQVSGAGTPTTTQRQLQGQLHQGQLQVQLLPAWSEYYRGLVDLGRLQAPEPVETVAPGPDGAFELTAPAPGVWTVRVSAPGFVAMERSLRPLAEPLELQPVVLLPDAGMDAQVLDSEGRPLAGVWVGVLPSRAGWEIWREAWEGKWMPARRLVLTDEDGRARVPRAPGEELLLRAVRRGGPMSVEISTSGGLVVARPSPGREWDLRVRDARGRPAPDVSVRLGEWRWPAGVTDAEGRLPLSLPDGEDSLVWLGTETGWKIRIPVPAGDAGEPSGDDPGDDSSVEPAPLLVTLPDPVRISGGVTDGDTGEPLADAMVWSGSDARELVFTDPHGRFDLEVAPASRAVVSAVLPRYRGYRQTASIREGTVRGLAFPLQPLLDLRGIVLDPSREPVAGARVMSRGPQRSPSWTGRGVFAATTGADGRFHIDRQPSPGETGLRIRAETEGHAPTELRWDPRRMGEELEIVLSYGAVLTGEVVDPQGQPLPGARIALFLVREQVTLREEGGEDYETLAGPDGRFSAAALPLARFAVEVRHPGYAPAVLQGVDTGPPEDMSSPEESSPEVGVAPGAGQAAGTVRTVDLGTVVLEPGAAIEGRVVGRDGQPVAGARIQTRRSRYRRVEAPNGPPPGGDPKAVTGHDGTFRLADFRAGATVSLEVAADGYIDVRVPQVVAPTETPLELVLERGGRLFGSVRDGAGRPVPRAWIQVQPWSGDVRSQSPKALTLTGHADEHGRFDFEAAPAGEIVLEVRARGFVPWRRTDLVIPGEGDAEPGAVDAEASGVGPVEVALARGLVLEGRVTAVRGGPAVRAEVQWWPKPEIDGQSVFAARQVTRTDTDGWYRFEGVAPFPGQISASQDLSRARRDIELSETERRFDLQLQIGPGIAGRVLDHRGEPLEGVRITALPLDFQQSWHRTTSKLDGTFHIPLDPGEYRLQAWKAGWAEAQPQDRLSVTDRPLESVELTLRRGARVWGTIDGLSGAQMGGLQLTGRSLSADRQTVSGEAHLSGVYRIAGVSPGTWEVEARFGSGRSARGTVEVEPETVEARLDLVFEPAVELRGEVRCNGEPGTGYRVSLSRIQQQDHPWVALNTRTDGAGRFRFSEVDPGTYRLAVRHEQGWVQVRELELSMDREVLLEASTTRVTGRLTEGLGDALAGGRVSFASTARIEGEPVSVSELSDAEGRFHIGALPEGTYQVTVTTERHSPKTFEARLAGTEVDLGDIRLDPGAGFALAPRVGPDGEIPEAVFVSLYPPGETQPLLTRQAPVEAGVATFAAAPAGSWSLLASARDTLPEMLSLEIPEDGLPEPIPVVFQRSATLQLRVPELQSSGGNAWARLWDSAGQPFHGVPVPGFRMEQGWPLHRGAGVVTVLPADTWTVEVTAADGRVWSARVTIEPGELGYLVLE